jgi:hypothetical protein
MVPGTIFKNAFNAADVDADEDEDEDEDGGFSAWVSGEYGWLNSPCMLYHRTSTEAVESGTFRWSNIRRRSCRRVPARQ